MFTLFSGPQPAGSPSLHRQLQRIEGKLDLILQHLGLEFPEQAQDSWMDEVQALANSGRKIEAIKVYREATGVGLKEAKDAVEAMMR